MEIPKWTDVWQAWASVGTAVFTALSVILVCVYTVITNRALRIAQRTHEESLRPVIILVKVMPIGGNRVATFKNSGGGLAVGLKLHNGSQNMAADDNVLAPGQTLEYVLPLQPEQGILDLSYSALTQKPIRTISYFLADGKAFNDYLPDPAGLSDTQVKSLYSAITKYALANHARLLASKNP